MSDDTPTGRYSPDDDDSTRPLPARGDRDLTQKLPTQGTGDQDAEGLTQRLPAQDAATVPPLPGLRPGDPSAGGGEAPTELLGAGGAVAPASRAEAAAAARSGPPRRTVVILSVIGAVLLVGILVAATVLLTRGSAIVVPAASGSASAAPSISASPKPTVSSTPKPTPTPSATPTPTPSTTTPAPPPPPSPTPTKSTALTVDSFTASIASKCDSKTKNPVELAVAWASTNGATAYFGVGAADAEKNGQGWTLPASGTQADFPADGKPFYFQCGNPSNAYTITVVAGNGDKVSRTVTVANTGDVY